MVQKETIINVVKNKFGNKGLYACCIPSSIILFELLKKEGYDVKLMNGYCSVFPVMFSCFHVWLEIDNEQIDIGNMILHTHRPDLKAFSQLLSKDKPDNCERIDMDNDGEIETLKSNLKSYDLYKSNEREWWKQSPNTLKMIKKDLCRILNKKK